MRWRQSCQLEPSQHLNDFITRAVGYLKAVDTTDAVSHSIGVAEQNSLVLVSVADGLALAYVVDEP